MGFQIEVKTGDAGPVTLRGCDDGTVEFCKWGEVIDPKTKVKRAALIAFKYYASIEQAFDKVFRMRVASAEATTLKELVQEIRRIRQDIKTEMGATDWTIKA